MRKNLDETTRLLSQPGSAEAGHGRGREGPQPARPAQPGAGTGAAAGVGADAAPRTGTPIRYPGLQPALLTLVLAALLTGLGVLGRPAAAGGVFVLQLVTAAGWFRLNGMWPARQGIALAALAAAVTDGVILFTASGVVFQVLLAVLGVGVLLVLGQQAVQRTPPGELTDALTVTLVATALTVLTAGWLPVRALGPDSWSDAAVLSVGVAAVAVTGVFRAGLLTLGRVLALPAELFSLLIALAAAAGSGVLAGAWTHVGAGNGALIGLAAAVGGLIGHRVAAYDFPSRFVHLTAGVALPLSCAVPTTYLAGWLLG